MVTDITDLGDNSGLEDVLAAQDRSASNLENAILTAGPRGRRSRTRSVQYWRMWTDDPKNSRHNWIAVGPALSPQTAMEYAEFQEKKAAVPLKQYGTWDGSKTDKFGDQTEVFGNNTRFNPLIRQRAIHEMPKSQFIAYGWHKNPVLRAMAPDEWNLDDVEEYVCEVDGRSFNSLSDLRKYIRAMYPEANAADAVGREMSSAITALGKNNLDGDTLLEIFQHQNSENAKMMAEVIASSLNAMMEMNDSKTTDEVEEELEDNLTETES